MVVWKVGGGSGPCVGGGSEVTGNTSWTLHGTRDAPGPPRVVTRHPFRLLTRGDLPKRKRHSQTRTPTNKTRHPILHYDVEKKSRTRSRTEPVMESTVTTGRYPGQERGRVGRKDLPLYFLTRRYCHGPLVVQTRGPRKWSVLNWTPGTSPPSVRSPQPHLSRLPSPVPRKLLHFPPTSDARPPRTPVSSRLVARPRHRSPRTLRSLPPSLRYPLSFGTSHKLSRGRS